MKTSYSRALTVIFATGVGLGAAQAATTPVNQDRLRVHNGIPSKGGDNLFSFSAEWRIDDGELFRTSGMTFLNADKIDPAAPPTAITKKLVGALKEGLMQLDPGLRGVTVQQDAEKAELTIANRAGYSVTSIVVRDYTNQALAFDLIDKAFMADHVQVSLDLVLAADVEYLDGFSAHKSSDAGPGEIEVQIDDQTPVIVKTDGKTTKELEQELVRQLAGAKIGDVSLVPHVIHTDTRNTKPFDGSEIQFTAFNAKSLKVHVRSKAVGVLSKFKYQDENNSSNVMQPSQMKNVLPVAILLIVGFLWYSGRKKRA